MSPSAPAARSAPSSPPGLLVAAPASNHGKTIITLGLLRHFRNAGVRVGSFKVGPDYIDPAFHVAAGGRPCRNLDLWAMGEATRAAVLAATAKDADLILGEGVMGLFDGPRSGAGSTADVAAATGLPVVLVIDARGQGASAAALLQGFARFRANVAVAGAIFNCIGGAAHARMIERACAGLADAPRILGFLPRNEALALPERHLGLVQAAEHPAIDAAIERAAALIAAHVDLDALRALARPLRLDTGAQPAGGAKEAHAPLPPLGQRIAVARDAAFSFAYAHLLEAWRAMGAEILPFSPLADEAPAAGADAVYLPGGYPELHAARLAAAARFRAGLAAAAARGAFVYGECGGYMVLGRGLVDGEGTRHAMAGLLPLETSFAEPRLHLGYRRARLIEAGPLGGRGARFRGHEFHYARTLARDGGAALFVVEDAAGEASGDQGLRIGNVAGSFLHLIDGERP